MEMPSALDFHVRTLEGAWRLTPDCLNQPSKHFGVMEIADRIFNDSTKCSAEVNDADFGANWRTAMGWCGELDSTLSKISSYNSFACLSF
jgi:hypothetical protein